MKRTIYSFVVAIILSGCSSAGDSSSSGITTSSSDITVERGPIIGAYVVDSQGNRAYNLGYGKYRFNTIPTYPISAYGGYIDANRDGFIDLTDAQLTLPLTVSSQSQTKLTIITTLSLNSDIKNEIIGTYGLTEEEIYTLTPSTSIVVAAISDVVFKYLIQNNIDIYNLSLSTFQSLNSDIENKISTFEESLVSSSMVDVVSSSEVELISQLGLNISSTQLSDIQEEIAQSSINQIQDPTTQLNSLPTSDLNEEQVEGLVFMYQEEKVARDVYNMMYQKWNLRIFNNIARSEQIHMDSVRAILEKYNIEVPVVADSVGVFELVELQNLYNTLITQGNISSNEALKVGVLVEETDIADLLERLEDAPQDIALVYNSLLNGSYNHLNAFSKQVN